MGPPPPRPPPRCPPAAAAAAASTIWSDKQPSILSASRPAGLLIRLISQSVNQSINRASRTSTCRPSSGALGQAAGEPNSPAVGWWPAAKALPAPELPCIVLACAALPCPAQVPLETSTYCTSAAGAATANSSSSSSSSSPPRLPLAPPAYLTPHLSPCVLVLAPRPRILHSTSRIPHPASHNSHLVSHILLLGPVPALLAPRSTRRATNPLGLLQRRRATNPHPSPPAVSAR